MAELSYRDAVAYGIAQEMRRDPALVMLGEDIAAANLVINGSTPVLVRTDGELIDLVRNGQGVLNVLSLATVKSEIDSRILELHPDTDATPVAGSQIRAVNS